MELVVLLMPTQTQAQTLMELVVIAVLTELDSAEVDKVVIWSLTWIVYSNEDEVLEDAKHHLPVKEGRRGRVRIRYHTLLLLWPHL
jgi:hypothetical protein